MASPPLVTYWHRQTAPLCLLLYEVAAFFLCIGYQVQHLPVVSVVMPLAGVVNLVLAASFHHLTVADEGEALSIRFGPLPLFRTAIRYDDIRRVELGRTTLLDGLGIHLSLRGGWVWNLWGRDCIVIHLRNGGIIRIGSDDTENLAGFIKTRIEEEEPGEGRRQR
jgi:hypothetical protein